MIYLLMTATIGSVILLGLITFVVSRDKNSKYAASREQSLELSESGIYWYRWYLAHNVEGKTVQQKKIFGRAGRPSERSPAAIRRVRMILKAENLGNIN